MTDKEIFEILKEKFAETIIEFVEAEVGENFIKVNPLEIDKVCSFLLSENNLQFNSLMNLSALD
ncbi:MAG: NADH-quinone oxidoreductase subunit C, partial [Bacteroidetes bacterium]|nr:NADH-quinone oxidoreductase subunit C [Bacteroidota bacterium]